MNFEEFLKKSIEDLSGFFVNKDECKISITKEGARNHIAVRGQGEDKKLLYQMIWQVSKLIHLLSI